MTGFSISRLKCSFDGTGNDNVYNGKECQK